MEIYRDMILRDFALTNIVESDRIAGIMKEARKHTDDRNVLGLVRSLAAFATGPEEIQLLREHYLEE